MKLKQYLLNQFTHTFLPIFLGLYFITSIIFLVKIAALTSVITMNVLELLRLYMYVIPTIVFYTLPISFFISLVITLGKLSSEYELIVITSFGLNPLKVLRVFLPITFILSLALLFISVGLIPKAKFLNERFLDQKQKEANFNIRASEFGQKFGDWLIYIDGKKDKTYEEVKLFKTENNKDQFIISKSAKLVNEQGELSFKLYEGKSFFIDREELNQINYAQLDINDSVNKNKQNIFTDSYTFWKQSIAEDYQVDKFSFYILTSLFPLISLFLVVAFGYYNPRYEKNKAVSYAMVSVVVFYIFMEILTENLLLHSLYIVPVFWTMLTYFVYSKMVKQQY
ncbi:LptF/LptG family permease [Halarcobacter bivalviorum]|uniref:LptF/LptG family permease n=1 Tax=Halarcobacter bivalviorum TaxID=663364 RepID=UPI00100B04CD|nr:LptF/LptG family permease [Halarcobacter bivalviorum]RXK05057.1 permease [Halarcobacter bivalviorum]